MAELVAAFICPHAPPMFTMRDAMDESVWLRVTAAYAEIKAKLEALAVDTVIVVGSDHYVLFSPSCLPVATIAIGDVWGPLDRLPGIERGAIENNMPLAGHILETTRDLGFDLAVSKAMGVDHAVGIPVRLCAPDQCRAIPLYIASGVEPLIRKQRAFDLGCAIGEAVRKWDRAERVAVIGSGGISHSVGIPGMGRVVPEFDQWVLDRFVAGDARALIDLADEAIIRRAGNGALEIRNFLVALGALNEGQARVIAYEPAPGWFTGMGFAEIVAASA